MKTEAQRRLNRLKWQAEQRRLDAIHVPTLKFLPDKKRLLLAYNEYHTGGATYERKQGQWTCTYAAHYLSFLLKKTPAEAKVELIKRGYEWEWRTPVSESAAEVQIPTDKEGLIGIQGHARQTKVQSREAEGQEGVLRGNPSHFTGFNPATAALQH